MTEESTFFNELQNGDAVDSQALQGALNELEQAFSRFERIIGRHADSLRLASRITTRNSSRSRIITGSITRLFDLFSGRGLPTRTVFNPNADRNSRFPSSYGQILSDLASSIQRISGRNL